MATVTIHARYDGWPCTVEIEVAKTGDLPKAVKWLTDHGFSKPAQPAASGNGNGQDISGEPPTCAIHGVAMHERESKGGGHFWSCNQKLADGQWCPYKPPKAR